MYYDIIFFLSLFDVAYDVIGHQRLGCNSTSLNKLLRVKGFSMSYDPQ